MDREGSKDSEGWATQVERQKEHETITKKSAVGYGLEGTERRNAGWGAARPEGRGQAMKST